MKKNKPKPPKPWNPEIESFDVALMRQHEYMKQLLARKPSQSK